MAKYCKQCGCYIPDSQSACLACGYDEKAEAAKKASEEQAKGKGFFSNKGASSSAAAYAEQSQTTVGGGDKGEYHGKAGNIEWSDGESWRKAADMKREQRQEWERKWAETEHRRREMENEFKRKLDAEGEQNSSERRTSYRAPGSTVRKTSDRTGYKKSGNATADSASYQQDGAKRILTVLSYLGAMCFIPMFLYNDDEFSQFHAKQGLILFIFGLIADALAAVPVVGSLLIVAKLYLIYKGMMNALSGKKEKLPFIGKIFG